MSWLVPTDHTEPPRHCPGVSYFREIGRGSFGVVYLALDDSDRRIALKHFTDDRQRVPQSMSENLTQVVPFPCQIG